jgi:nucleoside phosphorylase
MLVVAGIAGGFAQEGVSLGDVVVAKSVADLASRKIRQHEDAVIPEFRPREYATDSRISKLFQSGNFDRAKWEQRVIEQGEWPDGRRPTIHFGTVASVDEVVSSNEWVLKLRNAWPKLLGVEMEAGGVCAAAESFGLKVGVVRGISDHSDPAKSDTEWRRRAMKAVGTVVDELIKYNVPFSPE